MEYMRPGPRAWSKETLRLLYALTFDGDPFEEDYRSAFHRTTFQEALDFLSKSPELAEG